MSTRRKRRERKVFVNPERRNRTIIWTWIKRRKKNELWLVFSVMDKGREKEKKGEERGG